MTAKIDQGLFKGVAVVIDDGVDTEEDIKEIVTAIRSGGGHVVTLTALPDPKADLENFSNAAFFIMDWNLKETVPGVKIPEALVAAYVQENIEFLKRLSKHRHAPVFIFTKEDVTVVEEALALHPDLYRQSGDSHILIKSKADVGSRVYEVLNDWAQTVPSVATLKAWERNHSAALNALFVDFHDRTPYWPVLLWQTFKDDGVPAGEELGRLITRLVASRMKPLQVDLERFEEKVSKVHAEDEEGYHQALRSVLEGERLLTNDRIDVASVAPGDLYEDDKEGVKSYFLNIRAECDCVIRSGNRNPVLHLLKGRVVETPQINPDYANLVENDNEVVIFSMYKGQTLRFGFKDVKQEKWNVMKDRRVGRLLSPFITRVLQRYASYSQRPGLARLPSVFLPKPVADIESPPAE